MQDPSYPYHLKITTGIKWPYYYLSCYYPNERQEKFSKKFLKSSWQYKKDAVLYNQTTNKKAK